jgi:hypothetical protein|tara:strand:- start:531 stop:794 length:264 start_codon:yes stop_codon:yes gene_type:complete
MGKLKDNLASIAALIAAVVAIGGGFIKYGEITTKLSAIESSQGVDITPIAEQLNKNKTNIEVLKTEIQLLKAIIKEIKVESKNPLGG